jgi:membrane-associated phospholipid phosphatase
MASLGDLRDRLERELAGRPIVRAALPGAVLIALGLAAFAGLLDAVRENDDLSVFDRPVLAALVANRGPVATAVFSAITLVSGPIVLPLIVAVACGVWGLVRRDWWRPGLLVGAMVASTSISLAIKGIVARPRPPLSTMIVPGAEQTASFPSGHTIGAATLLLVAWYLVVSRHPTHRRQLWWPIATAVGAGAVGLSRLYLGYHFLTDVLAAFALAVAILGAVTIIDRVRAVRRSQRCPRLDSNQQPTD